MQSRHVLDRVKFLVALEHLFYILGERLTEFRFRLIKKDPFTDKIEAMLLSIKFGDDFAKVSGYLYFNYPLTVLNSSYVTDLFWKAAVMAL